MKIVSFKTCPFVQRVTALLEAKHVPYDIEYIDLSKKPAWFLEASPNGQVPILITDADQVLFESDAIAEYLDETTGTPISAHDPVKKAQDRAWSYLASKHYLPQCSAQRSTDEQTLEEGRATLGTAFAKMEARIETQLGEGPYFNGDTPGHGGYRLAAPAPSRRDYRALYGLRLSRSVSKSEAMAGSHTGNRHCRKVGR